MVREQFSIERFRELGSDVGLLEYRDGSKPVEFYQSTKADTDYPVVTWDAKGFLVTHKLTGMCGKGFMENAADIFIRIPDKLTVSYCNVYLREALKCGNSFSSIAECNGFSNNAGRIAILELTYNETTKEITTKIIKP